MNKLEKLINQIRNSNIQSVLSPELTEFRQLFSNIYINDITVQHPTEYINRYRDVFKFFNLNNKNQYKKVPEIVKENEKVVYPIKQSKSKFILLDDYDYKYFNKNENDLYSWMFFSIFANNHMMMLTLNERNDWLKRIKYDILTDFNKYDLFKQNSYNEDFKKSDLDSIFGMNQPIPLNMIRIYADVLNINCLYINMTGNIKYVNICQPNRATWFFIEDDNGKGWYNIIKKKNSINEFLRYNEINEIITNDMKNIDNLNDKTTLDILQNYAKGLGIDPKKEGKVGKRNKLKSELLEEIKVAVYVR
jgi:hypothetical protein